MATIAEFTIPANDFGLGRVFEHLRDAAIELERVVPTAEHILPYFWVRDGDAERIQETLAADSPRSCR
jgi:hypothetical protein